MEPGDMNDVFDIYRSVVGEERAIIDTDVIAANLGGLLDLSFVAEKGSSVVGFIIANLTYIGEPAIKAGLIQGIGVSPLHQGQGIAARLMSTLATSARTREIRTLRVMLSERDSQLEGFFDRQNFHRAKLAVYDTEL